ncbi:hypothetical protein PUN28_009179 [Cardiocondyla obscurior]|uniref:Uncharacterized protein n=1 Tax=Cardiocondyla obscurior TaxID=286306 RepID=A0AAW2FT87_9HYME
MPPYRCTRRGLRRYRAATHRGCTRASRIAAAIGRNSRVATSRKRQENVRRLLAFSKIGGDFSRKGGGGDGGQRSPPRPTVVVVIPSRISSMEVEKRRARDRESESDEEGEAGEREDGEVPRREREKRRKREKERTSPLTVGRFRTENKTPTLRRTEILVGLRISIFIETIESNKN